MRLFGVAFPCCLLLAVTAMGQRPRLVLRSPPGGAVELPTLPGRAMAFSGGRHWCVLARSGRGGALQPMLRHAHEPRQGWRDFIELPADARRIALGGGDDVLHVVWETGEAQGRRIVHRAFDPVEQAWRGVASDVAAGAAWELGDVAPTGGGGGGVAIGVVGREGAALLVRASRAQPWRRVEVADTSVPGLALAADGTTLHVAWCTAGADATLSYGQVDTASAAFTLGPEPVASAGFEPDPTFPPQMALDAARVPTLLVMARGKTGSTPCAISLWGAGRGESAVFAALGRSWRRATIENATVISSGDCGLARNEGLAVVHLAHDGQRVVARSIDRGWLGPPQEVAGGGGEGRFVTVRAARSGPGGPLALVASRRPGRARIDAVFARPDIEPDRPAVLYPAISQRRGARAVMARGRHRQRAAAIARGLDWLVAHQDRDGRWDADGFHRHDTPEAPCDGVGNPLNDVGVTALALMALIGDGDSMTEGRHPEAVARAVVWLCSQQDEEGRFVSFVNGISSATAIYGHALATLALCELCIGQRDALRRDGRLLAAAQAGLDHLEKVRNPYFVWRYKPRDNNNDTSVTSWCLQALAAGKAAGLRVNDIAFKLVGSWFDQVTDPASGDVGYERRGGGVSRQPGDHSVRYPPEHSTGLTAAGILCRVVLGQDPRDHEVIKASAKKVLSVPPVWDAAKGTVDMYSWFYAAHAVQQLGRRSVEAWDKHVDKAVVATQRSDGNFAGSWDPVGVWGHIGGRVYATAMGVMILEASYRLARRFG